MWLAGLPRADEIARAEQFHADLVADQQLAREHAAHDQQADVCSRRAREARHIPRPDRQLVRADDQLALRLLVPSGVEQRAQIGIDIEQSDLSGSRHRQGASSDWGTGRGRRQPIPVRRTGVSECGSDRVERIHRSAGNRRGQRSIMRTPTRRRTASQ